MGKSILDKVKKYVSKVYRTNRNDEIHYHNFTHAEEVVKVIEEISTAMNIDEQNKELLLIAGWFHDIGYTKCYDGHEDSGIEMARDFLIKNQFSEEKIEKVVSLINSTRLPRNPKNILEEIICDADLHHFGTTEFVTKEKLFRKELETKKGCKINDEVWQKNNLAFLQQHKFYTPYAKERFGYQKNINLANIQKKLND